MTTLTSERLTYRPPQTEDLEAYLSFARSDRAHQFPAQHLAPPSAEVFANMRVHWEIYGYGPFVFAPKGTEDRAGHAGAYYAKQHDRHEIAAALWGPEHEGQGLAVEALTTVMAYYRSTYDWGHIVSRVQHDNDRSHRMTKRLGATVHPDAALQDDPTSQLYLWPSGPLAP